MLGLPSSPFHHKTKLECLLSSCAPRGERSCAAAERSANSQSAVLFLTKISNAGNRQLFPSSDVCIRLLIFNNFWMSGADIHSSKHGFKFRRHIVKPVWGGFINRCVTPTSCTKQTTTDHSFSWLPIANATTENLSPFSASHRSLNRHLKSKHVSSN